MEGSTAATAGDFDDLAPNSDLGFLNQYLANLASQSLEHATRARDLKAMPGVFAVSVWEGGEDITAFEDQAVGHHNYANLMTATAPAMRRPCRRWRRM